MSAREEFLEALRLRTPGPWVATPEDDALVDKVLGEHAHELAEKIREAIPDIMDREQGCLHQDMLSELTDLIDPQMK